MTPHRTEDQVYAEVKGLNISYRAGKGELPILKDVSIVVRPGEALALVGESGSGKSTLAGALLGHLRTGSHVVSGSVTVDGLEVFNATAKQIRALRLHSAAFVPQNAGHALTPTMRIGRQVTEVLQYGEGLGDRDARDRAAELFAQVRLPQPEQLLRRYPHELSGGQQQRVAIAMALASRPDLLILDEPTTGLDVVNQAGILALVRKLREELNPAVVLVSHDLGVVASICDTVAVTYAGRVIEWGDVRQVFDRPSHPYTAGLLSTVPTLERPGLPAAMAGQPPVASEDRPGCSFADRCDLVADVCRTGNHPPLVAVTALASEEEPRWSACLRVAQLLSTAGTEGQVWERPAHDPGPRILTVRDLEIDYRKKPDPDSGPTVAGIDLDVHAGEVVALVGESGSGKSTIAWAVAGLRRPSGGEIRLADDDATAEGLDLTVSAARRSPSVRRRIQLIFQNADTSLNPRRTVGDAVTRPIKVFGLADDHGALVARRDQAFDDVGLPAQFAGRIPGQLSGGNVSGSGSPEPSPPDPRSCWPTRWSQPSMCRCRRRCCG